VIGHRRKAVIIKATCPTCGDVDLTPDAVQLQILPPRYSFVCPGCGDWITRPATPAIDEVLLRADVELTLQ
jgi:predicted RNA-binding Zn-ribbon protein involved in translation (DUF1610 family)